MAKIEPWDGDPSLQDWAASEATKVLADNWNQAVSEGYDIVDLISDVDEVTKKLRQWVSGVIAQHRKGGRDG